MSQEQYFFNHSNLLSFRNKLVMFRHSNTFQSFTTAIIIFYSLLLGLKTEVENTNLLEIISFLDTMITYYFVLEIGLKIYTEKRKIDFFKNKWNLFDFIVILVSVIPLESVGSVAVMRLLRIFRILRLISINDSIKQLITALEGAIPSIFNIILLMFIIFYVYAIMGVELFHTLSSGLWSDFGTAMLTLFRVLTFEDWTDVMYEAMELHPYSWIYFVSFIIINAFIIYNLFVAVIIDKISEINNKQIQNMLSDETFNQLLLQKDIVQIKKMLQSMQKEQQDDIL